jgi:hypothetical protein
MRYFLLMAFAIAGATSAWADNLPPVPKTIPVTVSAIIKEKVEPAPMPKAEPTKAEQPSCSAKEAPMPPVPAKPETACDQPGGEKCCHPVGDAIVFLANELLRKPIYEVRKAINDLEGRRLCREDRRLDAEAERLSCRAEELAEKAKHTCPCDIHAKLRLLIEQKDYARKANNLAVKKAVLECSEADHQERMEKLKAKDAELFHGCD